MTKTMYMTGCPKCGGEEVTVEELDQKHYTIDKDGVFNFNSYEPTGKKIKATCNECSTDLTSMFKQALKNGKVI